MNCILRIFFVFLTAGSADAGGVQSDAAVQKVIQMLGDMLQNAKTAKKSEEVGYAAFETQCGLDQAQLSASISEASGSITTVSAEIGELDEQVKTLKNELAKISQDLETFSADKKNTEAQRAKDHEAYLDESTDYEESVNALERAINVLQKQNFDRTASGALLQLSENAQLPQKAKDVITGFLTLWDDDSQVAKSPEANAYEFQSVGVIDLLKKLKTEFTQKLSESQKEEMNSKHAAQMVIMDLDASIEDAKTATSEKLALKDEKARSLALHKKELTALMADKKSDEELLSQRKTECIEKGFSFKEKQVLRTEEIEALAKAIEILKEADVAKVVLSQQSATKKAVSLAQLKGVAFLDQSRGASKSAGVKLKLMKYLEEQAEKLHSKNLNLLVEKLSPEHDVALLATGEDPFKKVKAMIEDMIARLLSEANKDAEKEGFCDKEMGKSKITRDKLTTTIDGLKASISEEKSTITMLTEDIAALSEEVVALTKSMAEATELRKKEKEQNAATVADATEASKAVNAALAVLKDFYSKASTATALVQVHTQAKQPVSMGTDEWNSMANPNFKGVVDKGHKKGMQTFGEVFKGQQDEAGGVIAMIEVIQSDLMTLKKETEVAEDVAAKDHQKFMTESRRAKAQKSKSIEMKAADKLEAEEQMQHDTEDMKATEDQLLAAQRYYAQLEPQCVDKGMTFKERTAARQEEIASLKEALAILSGTSI